MEENKKEKELKTHTIVLMAVVALFYDVIQIALGWLGIGWLILPVFFLHYFVWFRMHGISFLSWKRAPTLGFGALLEILTAGVIPSLTFVVLRVALDYKLKKIAPVLDIMKK